MDVKDPKQITGPMDSTSLNYSEYTGLKCINSFFGRSWQQAACPVIVTE